jgi:hypothetical protein
VSTEPKLSENVTGLVKDAGVGTERDEPLMKTKRMMTMAIINKLMKKGTAIYISQPASHDFKDFRGSSCALSSTGGSSGVLSSAIE